MFIDLFAKANDTEMYLHFYRSICQLLA